MHNIDTSDMEQDEINKLLKLNFSGENKPISFILLDLEHRCDVFTNKS